MAYQPQSGSVISYQAPGSIISASVFGTVNAQQTGARITSVISSTPSSMLVGASVFGNVGISGTPNVNVAGSVASYPLGTIISSLVNVIPSSVIVGASIFGQLPAGTAPLGSVAALQGTNPWIITGSIQGVLTQNVSGSVASYPLGTIISSLVSTVPSSVQVGVSVMGHAPVVIVGGSVATSTTNSSVMLLNGANVIGSVATLQGTIPWIITGSIQGGGAGTEYAENVVTPSVTGTAIMFKSNMTTSIMSVVTPATPLPVSVQGNIGITNTNLNVGGSVIGFQGGAWTASVVGNVGQIGTIISSLVSTVPSSVIVGSSIFGQLPAGTAPLGSVATLQGTNPWLVSFGNSSIFAAQQGTVISSLVSTVPSSVIVGASIFGQLPAGTAPLGSVAVLQGTNPWIETFSNSSILAVPVGSVITVFQAPSLVGTYAEDVAHVTADKGVFILGVRNDAVSSITTAERDYSPVAVDEAGRNIIVPFAGNYACIISYVGSIVSGSVQLIQASVIGSRSYVTDFSLSNTYSVATLVTIQGGDTSLLGQFIVPAGGGNNKVWQIPLRTTLSQDLAFKAVPSASVLHITLKGYQAP